MPYGISSCYQLDQSISVLRVVRWYFSFLITFLLDILLASRGEPDQTARSAGSGLVLYCLPMSHKNYARHIWVKSFLVKYWYQTCYFKYFTNARFGTEHMIEDKTINRAHNTIH